MTAALALALLLVPLPAPGAARLRVLLPTGLPDRPALRGFPMRHATPVVGVCVGLAAVLAGLGPVVGLSAALAAATATHAARRVRVGRTAAAERATTLDAITTLAAELRAGQPPAAALGAAATVATGRPAAVLAEAAATARLDGSVPAALRAAPGNAAFDRLAAAWQLSTATGAGLASVLDEVARTARTQRQQERQLASLLAGPRATASLLAVLPVAGLALGAAIGASPLTVLLHTTGGHAALLAGVLLNLAGLTWTDRIVRAAGATR